MVLGVSGGSIVASMAIAAVPDDITTPVASMLVDISQYLFLLSLLIKVEQLVMSIFGSLGCLFILPCCGGLYLWSDWRHQTQWKAIAKKIAAVCLVFVLIVPFSILISSLVDSTMNLSADIKQVTEKKQENLSEEKNWWDSTVDAVGNAFNTVANASEVALSYVNSFINAIIALILTSAVIPLATMFLLGKLSKHLLAHISSKQAPYSLPESNHK